MTDAVKLLKDWVQKHRKAFIDRNIRIVENFQNIEKMVIPKANIGIIFDGIAISYTVWAGKITQTELIVVNIAARQTIVMQDKEISEPNVISVELDHISNNLMNEIYKNFQPDPKLTTK